MGDTGRNNKVESLFCEIATQLTQSWLLTISAAIVMQGSVTARYSPVSVCKASHHAKSASSPVGPQSAHTAPALSTTYKGHHF